MRIKYEKSFKFTNGPKRPLSFSKVKDRLFEKESKKKEQRRAQRGRIFLKKEGAFILRSKGGRKEGKIEDQQKLRVNRVFKHNF